MNAVEKARSLVNEIRANNEPMKLVDKFQLAGRLMGRMTPDQASLSKAVKDRDIEALDAILRDIENPPKPERRPEDDIPVTDADKHAAMRAFRKRLKLTRLDDESRISSASKTTGGRKSGIDAIIPPTDFPPRVWRALAEDGELKHTGGGFYRLGSE